MTLNQANPAQQQPRKRLSVDQALAAAARAYGMGKFADCERIAIQILEQRPKSAAAFNLQSAAQSALGRAAEAVKTMQKAIRLNPENATYHSNLGEMERQRGKLDEALKNHREAARLGPRNAIVANNFGVTLYDRKSYEEAVTCYQQALALKPDYAEAYNNLGNAMRALAKRDEAIELYEKALLYKADYPEAYNNLGSALQQAEKPAEAEFSYRRAIQLRPSYLEAYHNLVLLLGGQENYDEALRVLGDGLKINDKHVPFLIDAARIQVEKVNYQPAEQACKLALAQDPDNYEAMAILGRIYQETDRMEEAAELLIKAVKLKPEAVEAGNLLASVFKALGRLDESRELYRKVVTDHPHAYGAFANMADLEKFTPDHELLRTMEKIYAEAEDPLSTRYTSLHFALGKAYDDAGMHDKAFSHYSLGAKQRRGELNFKEDESIRFIESIKAAFPLEVMQNRKWVGNPTQVPVLIVGMPRSGSTLIEQILSSHPDIYGAGEVKYMSHAMTALRGRFPSLPRFPDMFARLNADHLSIIADEYMTRLTSRSNGAARITDKLLSNYLFLGLFVTLFPNGKILHTRRNPVDTCLSAFTKLFRDDMPHSYDLGELGRYYVRYQGLMEHWKKVLPAGAMMEVDYEAVVDDYEGVARQIISFIGLEWDAACIDFHTSSRPVRTASVVQVRKPIYRGSVERWRSYGANLNPLLEALGLETVPS